MRFEWDENKRRANIVKHGIDFVRAMDAFDGRPIYEYPSSFQAEPRRVTIAQLGQSMVAVIWTGRGEGVARIISARRARNDERRKYRFLYH